MTQAIRQPYVIQTRHFRSVPRSHSQNLQSGKKIPRAKALGESSSSGGET
jgi:hypothetical protein